MVKNLPTNAGDVGSIPGSGTKIPHSMGNLCTAIKTQCSQKKVIKQPSIPKLLIMNPYRGKI